MIEQAKETGVAGVKATKVPAHRQKATGLVGPKIEIGLPGMKTEELLDHHQTEGPMVALTDHRRHNTRTRGTVRVRTKYVYYVRRLTATY